MSELTERPPSPIPVPWPFHPPHALEPSHPLYNHVPRDRDRERQSVAQRMWDDEWAGVDREWLQERERDRKEFVAQSLWDAEWEDVDRQYLQDRERSRRRTAQNHQHDVDPPVPTQPYQRQQDQGHHNPPTETPADPCGGRERWTYLGRSYARDNHGSEWMQVPKPKVNHETDLYGFPPGDPFYRPHLRYTPRGDDPGDGDAQRRQAAMPPVGNGPPQMPPPQTGNGGGGDHAQPINHGSNPQSIPRPPSAPPMPYRPREMNRDLGPAGRGYPGPHRSVQQDRYHDPRHPTQPNDVRGSTGHGQPLSPGGAQQQDQAPATSEAPPGRLETREDPWEFLFGSKGYVTVAPGDEPPFWWNWKD